MNIAYICLQCGHVHGWLDHSNVMKITSHQRYADCDVWRCPSCNFEHRTMNPFRSIPTFERVEFPNLDDPVEEIKYTRTGTDLDGNRYEERHIYYRQGNKVQRRCMVSPELRMRLNKRTHND